MLRWCHEVGHPHRHGKLDLFAVIAFYDVLTNDVRRVLSGLTHERRERDLDQVLLLHPVRQRLRSPFGLQKSFDGGEVEPTNGFERPLVQVRLHVVQADFFQLAIIGVESIAPVGPEGHRLPVPQSVVFDFGGQVFSDLFFDLSIGVSVSLIFEILDQVVRLIVLDGTQFEFQFAAHPSPFDHSLRPIRRLQEMLCPVGELVVDLSHDQLAAVGPFENRLSVRIDSLALLVHDFVVFEQIFALFKVSLFDLLLRAFDLPRDHLAFDSLTGLHAQRGEPVFDPLAAEFSHQVIFERQEESARSAVSLATGAAAQLKVNAPRLMPLGADDVEATDLGNFLAFVGHPFPNRDLAGSFLPDGLRDIQPRRVLEVPVLIDLVLEFIPREILGVATENDVRAATGHVGRDRHRIHPARLGDDFRFTFVILRVQDVVLHAVASQLAAQLFRVLDRHGAEQHGAAGLVNLFDLIDDGVPLLGFCAIDRVREIDSLERPVGRHRHHVELVNLQELGRLGHRRSGHTR